MIERVSVVRRVVCGAVLLGGLLASQAAWADQAPGAPAEPALCPPEECGEVSCFRDGDCGFGLVCIGVFSCGPLHPSDQPIDPNEDRCRAEDSPGLCQVPPSSCVGDYECGTEQVCFFEGGAGGGGEAPPDGDCACDANGNCGCAGVPIAPQGVCRDYDELVVQDPCAAVSCEQGYECVVVSPTCAPGEPCPTVEPWAECAPTQEPIGCSGPSECPEGWACEGGAESDPDELEHDECNPAECGGEGDRAAPAPFPSMGLCVPPLDEEDEDDGGSLFERDGFVNGGEGSEGGGQEGCAVGQVGGGRGSSWGLGALVVGALALLRRRR